jgi:hypothetical protein
VFSGKNVEALKYVEYFVFSSIIRIRCIDKVRTISSRQATFLNNQIFSSPTDFVTCLKLFKQTHVKNINLKRIKEIYSIKICKTNKNKISEVKSTDVLDKILQLQFLFLLEPVIDTMLSENFYGFRKNRNALQAVSFLSKSLQGSHLSNFVLILASIKKCFNNTFSKFVCSRFPFPSKYGNLLHK